MKRSHYRNVDVYCSYCLQRIGTKEIDCADGKIHLFLIDEKWKIGEADLCSSHISDKATFGFAFNWLKRPGKGLTFDRVDIAGWE